MTATGIARYAGLAVLAWLGVDLFALAMLYPYRPGNAFTWWTLALYPAPVALAALMLYPLLQLLQPPLRALGRLPALLQVLLMVAGGLALIMLPVIYRSELGALAPFTNPFALVRW